MCRPNFKHVLVSWCILAFMVASVRATIVYEYKPDEYVTVDGGQSPDGQYAITTHGEGELGDEHFHVYLMDAKAGKKIGPLTEIKKFLDSGAGGYSAQWTADSAKVSITYREDRHKLVTIVYRVKKGRAYRLSGPSD